MNYVKSNGVTTEFTSGGAELPAGVERRIGSTEVDMSSTGPITVATTSAEETVFTRMVFKHGTGSGFPSGSLGTNASDYNDLLFSPFFTTTANGVIENVPSSSAIPILSSGTDIVLNVTSSDTLTGTVEIYGRVD